MGRGEKVGGSESIGRSREGRQRIDKREYAGSSREMRGREREKGNPERPRELSGSCLRGANVIWSS